MVRVEDYQQLLFTPHSKLKRPITANPRYIFGKMSTSSPTPRASASADEKAEFRQEPQNPLTDSKPSSEHDLEKDGGEVQPVPTKKSIRDDSDHEWITGIKLFLVMAGMTLACFLMLLDTSIITTVRFGIVFVYALV